MSEINSFDGPYRFLSNFWPAPVLLDNVRYLTVEHAYQAAKTTDLAWRQVVRETQAPGKAKALGRSVPKRPNWEGMKLAVMTDLVRQKFCGGNELSAQLLATGDALIREGNNWGDSYWGCTKMNGMWVGSNLLGKLLMEIRKELGNVQSKH